MEKETVYAAYNMVQYNICTIFQSLNERLDVLKVANLGTVDISCWYKKLVVIKECLQVFPWVGASSILS